MIHGARILFLAGVTAVLAGCGDGSRPTRRAESVLGNKLAGTWDITLHLEQAPSLVSDTLRMARNLGGSIGLLANRSLDTPYPGVGAPINYGTYDIDFTVFGFDARDEGKIPTVAVDSAGKDSIEIALSHEPGEISVRMEGWIRSDTVNGRWQVSLPRLGAGGGSFFMTRRTRRF